MADTTLTIGSGEAKASHLLALIGQDRTLESLTLGQLPIFSYSGSR
jgi:hypothetical protein